MGSCRIILKSILLIHVLIVFAGLLHVCDKVQNCQTICLTFIPDCFLCQRQMLILKHVCIASISHEFALILACRAYAASSCTRRGYDMCRTAQVKLDSHWIRANRAHECPSANRSQYSISCISSPIVRAAKRLGMPQNAANHLDVPLTHSRANQNFAHEFRAVHAILTHTRDPNCCW